MLTYQIHNWETENCCQKKQKTKNRNNSDNKFKMLDGNVLHY